MNSTGNFSGCRRRQVAEPGLVNLDWYRSGQSGTSHWLSRLFWHTYTNESFREHSCELGSHRAPCSFDMAPHADMAAMWQSAPAGKFSPMEQMRAVALCDSVRDVQGGSAVNLPWIADRLTLAGGGNRHPTRQAVRKLLQRVDADKMWYPGKVYRARNGPWPRLTKAKRRAIAVAISRRTTQTRGISTT